MCTRFEVLKGDECFFKTDNLPVEGCVQCHTKQHDIQGSQVRYTVPWSVNQNNKDK